MSATSGPSATAVTADALDKQQIEHLHAATLKASDSCFELEKLCATVLVPAGTLLSVFSQQTLNPAVFGAALMVIAAFWLADGVATTTSASCVPSWGSTWRDAQVGVK